VKTTTDKFIASSLLKARELGLISDTQLRQVALVLEDAAMGFEMRANDEPTSYGGEGLLRKRSNVLGSIFGLLEENL
jgi:hypothetical protein